MIIITICIDWFVCLCFIPTGEINMNNIATKNTDKVQVEISSHLLTHLLDSGLLHCGDCKCLNAKAKSVIWHTLLASSTNCDGI
jgi:hypothetical protein